MLKNKLKTLVELNGLSKRESFEVILDSQAAEILGGGTCQSLSSCGEFKGSCPNLTSCGTYTAPDLV
jgi:hypothetical protein